MLIFIIWLESAIFEPMVILLVLFCISITLKLGIIAQLKMIIYLGVFLENAVIV